MPKDEMTERMLRALDNPYVTFLGHLTGRKLLSRDGYSVDFERIFEKAGQRGVMIEINGNPNRLDLDWRHIRRAIDLGVGFSITPTRIRSTNTRRSSAEPGSRAKPACRRRRSSTRSRWRKSRST